MVENRILTLLTNDPNARRKLSWRERVFGIRCANELHHGYLYRKFVEVCLELYASQCKAENPAACICRNGIYNSDEFYEYVKQVYETPYRAKIDETTKED